jgi:hypothetical protein
VNADKFADILANAGVIDAAAVSDPDGYDNGATLARVRVAFAALCNSEPPRGREDPGFKLWFEQWRAVFANDLQAFAIFMDAQHGAALLNTPETPAEPTPTPARHECGGAWHRYGVGFRCDCGAFRQ